MDKLIVDSKKVAEMKYKALQKLAANQDRPLSEASIEAKAVIEVINELYQLNEVSPQYTPAVCEYSGLRPVEGYKQEDKSEWIQKEAKDRHGNRITVHQTRRSVEGIGLEDIYTKEPKDDQIS